MSPSMKRRVAAALRRALFLDAHSAASGQLHRVVADARNATAIAQWFASSGAAALELCRAVVAADVVGDASSVPTSSASDDTDTDTTDTDDVCLQRALSSARNVDELLASPGVVLGHRANCAVLGGAQLYYDARRTCIVGRRSDAQYVAARFEALLIDAAATSASDSVLLSEQIERDFAALPATVATQFALEALQLDASLVARAERGERSARQALLDAVYEALECARSPRLLLEQSGSDWRVSRAPVDLLCRRVLSDCVAQTIDVEQRRDAGVGGSRLNDDDASILSSRASVSAKSAVAALMRVALGDDVNACRLALVGSHRAKLAPDAAAAAAGQLIMTDGSDDALFTSAMLNAMQRSVWIALHVVSVRNGETVERIASDDDLTSVASDALTVRVRSRRAAVRARLHALFSDALVQDVDVIDALVDADGRMLTTIAPASKPFAVRQSALVRFARNFGQVPVHELLDDDVLQELAASTSDLVDVLRDDRLLFYDAARGDVRSRAARPLLGNNAQRAVAAARVISAALCDVRDDPFAQLVVGDPQQQAFGELRVSLRLDAALTLLESHWQLLSVSARGLLTGDGQPLAVFAFGSPLLIAALGSSSLRASALYLVAALKRARADWALEPIASNSTNKNNDNANDELDKSVASTADPMTRMLAAAKMRDYSWRVRRITPWPVAQRREALPTNATSVGAAASVVALRSLRFMTWNVLATSMLERTTHVWSPARLRSVAWHARFEHQLREIASANADIVCLQELQVVRAPNERAPSVAMSDESLWNENLARLGYQCHVAARARSGMTLGCGIAWRSAKLRYRYHL